MVLPQGAASIRFAGPLAFPPHFNLKCEVRKQCE